MRIAFPVAVAAASALMCALASLGSCVGYLDADAGVTHGDTGPSSTDTGASPSDSGRAPSDSGGSVEESSADTSVDVAITDSGVSEGGPADVVDSAMKDSATSQDTSMPPTCTLDPYACAVLADQPLLYVRFDETNLASPAKDTSGNTCGGTYPNNGATSTKGVIPGDKTNYAVHLSSSNTGILMNNCADFPAAGAKFTAEFWLKPDPYLADAGTAFVLDHEVFGPRNGWEVDFTEGDIQLELWNANNDIGVANTTGAPITAGTWHYLVFEYDGAISTPYVYVDGVNVFNHTVLGGTIPAIDTTWTIGKQNCCDEAQFAGAIDELAIYPGLLVSSEISLHYALATADGGM